MTMKKALQYKGESGISRMTVSRTTYCVVSALRFRPEMLDEQEVKLVVQYGG
jgi:hypothetical protein